MPDPQYEADDLISPAPFPEPKPLFLGHPLGGWSKAKRRFNLMFRSRSAGDEEFYVIWGWDPDALEIHFPVSRRLMTV